MCSLQTYNFKKDFGGFKESRLVFKLFWVQLSKYFDSYKNFLSKRLLCLAKFNKLYKSWFGGIEVRFLVEVSG